MSRIFIFITLVLGMVVKYRGILSLENVGLKITAVNYHGILKILAPVVKKHHFTYLLICPFINIRFACFVHFNAFSILLITKGPIVKLFMIIIRLYQPLDGVTNHKYKLLHFLSTKYFFAMTRRH
jgi:hypothetical protein